MSWEDKVEIKCWHSDCIYNDGKGNCTKKGDIILNRSPTDGRLRCLSYVFDGSQ